MVLSTRNRDSLGQRMFQVSRKIEQSFEKIVLIFIRLNLRCSNVQGVHVLVVPDLEKTVKVGSDHSENVTHVYKDAMKGKLIYSSLIFIEKVVFED